MSQQHQRGFIEVEHLPSPWFGSTGDSEEGVNLNKMVAFRATPEDPALKDEVKVAVYLEGCAEPVEMCLTWRRYEAFLRALKYRYMPEFI